MCCNTIGQHKFDEELRKQFFNRYELCNHDKNNLISLMQKGVYPYEYMDDWDKFNKILLPEKEDFYSHVNMDDIIDADYMCPKKVCKDFEKKT